MEKYLVQGLVWYSVANGPLSMDRIDELKARALSKDLKKLFPAAKKIVLQKPKAAKFAYPYKSTYVPKKKQVQIPKPRKEFFNDQLKERFKVRDGYTPQKGVDYFTDAEKMALVKEILEKVELPEIELPEVTPDFAAKIVKALRALPEKDRLEVQDIRNAKSFLFGGKKYQFSELMHGGGGTTSGGAAVTTQYLLTAVQAGSDVTIDLTQLLNYATFDSIITLFRNNVPQTEGASYNFTFANPIITVFGADAGEIFNLTYSYAA